MKCRDGHGDQTTRTATELKYRVEKGNLCQVAEMNRQMFRFDDFLLKAILGTIQKILFNPAQKKEQSENEKGLVGRAAG